MTTPNYDIDYNDSRFTEVNTEKEEALTEIEETYGGMIGSSDEYFQAQIEASKEWAETQKKNQQAQTDFAIEQIEQQKEQAKKDYTKEQSGAYVDWQKQSNQYGANAEAMAAQGMAKTGYSESSQVRMYTAYQNRITTARESYNLAVQNYNNAITEARLQNNSILAEIAYNALQKQLELSLQGFQYKNQLLLELANQKREIDNTYYQRYQDVLEQINHENALKEQVRQQQEAMAFQKSQLAQQKAIADAQLALEQEKFDWQKAQAASSSGSSGGGSGGGGTIKKSSSKSSKTSNGTVKSASKNKSEIVQSTGNDPNKKLSKSSNSSPTIDMDSVLALGFGPISASRLAELEEQGIVRSYESGNKIKFQLSASALKQKSLLG